MQITGNMKMVDLIQMDNQLLAVIQLLNIPLGFKEKTIEEVCKQHSVDVEFCLHLVNAFHDKAYFNRKYFEQFPVDLIINYLKNGHRCYLDFRIPQIERQLVQFEKQVDVNDKNVEVLLKFFREYINEFTLHIQSEEQQVFPYIEQLSKSIENDDRELVKELEGHSIEKYHEGHNQIEETLFDLKNILLKYLPPPSNNFEYNNLVLDIFRLESDLLDHADLEEKILFPRVAEMENKIWGTTKSDTDGEGSNS
jgi:regulator of cell morphogenesis and NO signaling